MGFDNDDDCCGPDRADAAVLGERYLSSRISRRGPSFTVREKGAYSSPNYQHHTNYSRDSDCQQQREQHQILSDPAEHAVIPVVPGPASGVVEEHPGSALESSVHHDTGKQGGMGRELMMILLPYLRQEPLACGVTDGEVG
nr:hypothetical protein CFP56_72495 [Quercus suber]